MFLSKIGSVYYLFYENGNGKRHKVSTGSRRKREAISFQHHFKPRRAVAKKEPEEPKGIHFSEFIRQYSAYSTGVHTPKTFKTYQSTSREWLRVEGDAPIQSIGIRQIENFLSVKKVEASDWSARKYYISLAAAFEKAVHWEFISVNPFRKVRNPRAHEVLPVFFI